MATFTRTNGWAKPGEQIGRDVKFINLGWSGIETSYAAANSNFEQATRVLQKFCTITIVGTPYADNVTYMVEGLPAGSVLNVNGTLQAIATALKTDTEAAIGGTATWTIYDGLNGNSFA
jgi:hypothetical protein